METGFLLLRVRNFPIKINKYILARGFYTERGIWGARVRDGHARPWRKLFCSRAEGICEKIKKITYSRVGFTRCAGSGVRAFAVGTRGHGGRFFARARKRSAVFIKEITNGGV